MKATRGGLAGFLALTLVLGSVTATHAQDRAGVQHRCPSCGTELPQKRCETCGAALGPSDDADVDRKLHESLRREFGEPDPDLPPPPPPEAEPEPPPPPPSHKKHDDDDDDRFRVTLGFYAAHWAAQLYQVHATNYRKNWLGPGLDAGGRVNLDGGPGSVADLGMAQTQTYHAWIDLGRHVTIEGGARYATYRDTVNAPPLSYFAHHYFTSAQPLMTKFQFLSSDVNVGVHPISCEWGRLGVLVGARYVHSRVRLSTNANFAGPDDSVSQTLEALVPTIGLGGAFRPIHKRKLTIELYGRGVVGGYDLETYKTRRGRDGRRYRGHRGYETDRKRYTAFTLEADGGVNVILFGHVGIMAGYRFEVTQLARKSETESKQVAWRVGGPYAGVVIQF